MQTPCPPARHRSRWLLIGLLMLVASLVWSGSAAAQGVQSWRHEAADSILSIASSGDGSVVAIGSRDNALAVFSAEGEQLWTYQAQSSITGVDVSEDGQYVAISSADRHARLFDSAGNLLWEYRHSSILQDVAISSDGEHVVAVSLEGRNAVLLNRAGDLLWNKVLSVPLETVDMYGTGDKVRPVIGARDSRVYVLNAQGDTLMSAGLADYVRAVAVSRSGARIAVALNNGDVAVINGGNGTLIWDYATRRERGTDQAVSVAISDDGATVVAGVTYGKVFVFDENGAVTQELEPAKVPMEAVGISRDGQVLMYGGRTNVASVSSVEASAAAFVSGQNRTRNLLIVTAVLVVVLVSGGALAARYTTWGSNAWQATSRPARSLIVAIWRARASYIMLLPGIALLAVFNYYPAFSGLYHGFTRWTPGLRAEWIGLENYRGALNNQYLRTGVVNAIILIVTGFAKLILPLLVAELIFNLRSARLQYWMRTAYVIPLVVPGVVGVLLWVNIYDPNYGMLNQTLRMLNLEELTRVWLGDRSVALGSIIFMGFPWIGAFPLLLLYGGLIGIPTELFEAARMDGANLWQRFWKIDLPLLMTPLKTLLILGFIGGVQSFEAVFLTTAGGPGHSTYVPALELYFQATRFNRMGMASAIGTILFVVILAGTIINMKYIRGSETEYQA